MRPVDWGQINWPAVALNSIYVLALALAVAFFSQVFGLSQWSEFNAALTLTIAFIVVWVSFRVAMRAGSQPLMHGLLIGLAVALAIFALNYLTWGIGVPEIAGFLIQLLGGMLGGRMAQRTLEGPHR